MPPSSSDYTWEFREEMSRRKTPAEKTGQKNMAAHKWTIKTLIKKHEGKCCVCATSK